MNNKTKEKTVGQIVNEETELLRKQLTERFPDFPKWEKEYAPRKLNVIEVEDKYAVLRPIGAEEIGQYTVALVDPERGMVVATRYILEELWLGGDDVIRDDEEYFIAAMIQSQYIVETKKSRFTKL